jgi:hypothetical protein
LSGLYSVKLFGRDAKRKSGWKAEYYNELYKIYDSNKKLAGYFFPDYRDLVGPNADSGDSSGSEGQEEAIDRINSLHETVHAATLLVPMTKLSLLDNQEGLNIHSVIDSLEANLARSKAWLEWLEKNASRFKIAGAAAYTAREDRNMLSIALGIASEITLGEKEVTEFLTPILDALQENGLL